MEHSQVCQPCPCCCRRGKRRGTTAEFHERGMIPAANKGPSKSDLIRCVGCASMRATMSMQAWVCKQECANKRMSALVCVH